MPRKPSRSQFDHLWKTQPFMTSGVMYLLPRLKKEKKSYHRLQSRVAKGVSSVVSHIHSGIKDGTYDQATVLRGKGRSNPTKNISDAMFDELESRGYRGAKEKECVVQVGQRSLLAYTKRFKDMPASPPRLRRTTSTYLKTPLVQDNNPHDQCGTVTLTTLRGRKIAVPYKIPNSYMKKKHLLLGKLVHRKNKGDYIALGGNLVFERNRWTFTAKVDVPFAWSYDPVAALGDDCNQDSDNFLRFSDGWLIEHTEEMKTVIREIHGLNSIMWNRSMVKNTKKRSKVRAKVKELERQLEVLMAPVCNKIADYVEKHKYLMCIDGAKPGGNSGTYGQDALLNLLPMILAKRRIPYVIVPSYYSSSCHCGQLNTERSKNPNDTLHCKACDMYFDAHFCAAKTIAEWGWTIWQKGMFSHRIFLNKLKATSLSAKKASSSVDEQGEA